MAMDLELSLTGTVPGHISHTLFCYVLNLEDPLHLHVDTTIKVSPPSVACVKQLYVVNLKLRPPVENNCLKTLE